MGLYIGLSMSSGYYANQYILKNQKMEDVLQGGQRQHSDTAPDLNLFAHQGHLVSYTTHSQHCLTHTLTYTTLKHALTTYSHIHTHTHIHTLAIYTHTPTHTYTFTTYTHTHTTCSHTYNTLTHTHKDT